MKLPLKKTLFGLIGKSLSHSFSRDFFLEKFQREKIAADYLLFELAHIKEIEKIFLTYRQLKGVNVTIPYKKEILPFLDKIDAQAQLIKAINTIKIEKGKLIGYNTDVKGFRDSFKKHLKAYQKKALILGSGGSAQAISFVLGELGLDYLFISRDKKQERTINYHQVDKVLLEEYKIVINCTPVGNYPYIEDYPPIPYEYLNQEHYLYDLIYNPSLSKFLEKGKAQGTFIKNGLEMLHLQALYSWEIWKR